MQLANLMHEVKFLTSQELIDQVGEVHDKTVVVESVLAAERLGASACLFATRGLTRYVYGEVMPPILASNPTLSTADVVRAAFLNFSARDAIIGSTVLVVGSLGQTDCRALSFDKRSVSAVVCPHPSWSEGSLPPASDLVDVIVCAVAADKLAEVLRSRSVSTLYFEVSGDDSADLRVIRGFRDLLMVGATMILYGNHQKVENLNAKLRSATFLKLWAQVLVPVLGSDGSDGELFSYYEVLRSIELHLPPSIRQAILPRGVEKIEPARSASAGPYRYLPRSEIAAVADEVIRFADERIVSIPDPVYVHGPENTEAIWTGQFGVQPQQWLYPGQMTCPPLEVCRFDNLRVVGTGGFITRKNELFEGSMRLFTEDMFVSWGGVSRTDVTRSANGQLSSARAGQIEQVVSGPTLIMTDSGLPMHYHFLFDFLPRLCFRENFTIRDCKLAIPDTVLPSQVEILKRYYALAEDKIVIYSVGGGSCLFERAYVAPTLVSDEWAIPEVISPRTALVHARPPENTKFQNLKRIYISRRDTRDPRRLVNEDALAACLVKHGFVEVFPGDFSYDEEMYIFQNAEVVVGAFGSGMANLIFCSPGAHVMLLQPDATNWRILSFVMGYLGLSYGYIFGESFRRAERMHNTEWLVDIDLVERELNSVLSRFTG
ncbi:glycosyltransferase family 61 protein [Methylobacterium durans]|uniref:glycosyltransferase family 61 protein n=1 Tax=Methylobacterium durans TaxID=2202825 RepID=UPI002AFF1FC1|nr:glycosyltransferase family 61 protein [Methylobacterium durans]MEA1835256.1 glycosyltransferase family 61 protein [Methylobacterium durans]